MQTSLTCHLLPTWHEWNTNANDIMMTWFGIYANLVMLCLACKTCAHVNGTCALCRNSMSMYSSSLECMQADPNLVKITASHFWVLNTQNANYNMPNMIPIASLNENFTDCNKNLAWGEQEPFVYPYMFWYKTKGEKLVKTSFCILFM